LGAGAALLSPLLARVIKQAQAQDGLPLRFVLVDASMGWDKDRFEPPNSDLVAGGLNPAMQSLPFYPEVSGTTDWDPTLVTSPRGAGLNKYKDRILLLDEFYNFFNMGLHGNGRAHRTFEPTPLDDPEAVDSGVRHKEQSGRTLENVVADHIGVAAPYPVVSVSVSGNPEGPYEFYDRYFAELDLSERDAALARLERRRRRIDRVRLEVDAVKGGLGSRDREKMDAYVNSLGNLDAALTRQAGALNLACELPPPPASGLASVQKKYAPIDLARFESLFETGLNALVCGLTNVLYVQPVPGRANWHFLRNEDDKHNTEHSLINGDAKASQHLVNIDQWVAGRVTDIADRLASVPEGDGTALDRTLILWLDDSGGSHHTGDYQKELPQSGKGVDAHRALLLGNPVGYFEKTGLWKRYPRRTQSMGDLYTTVLNALGVPAEHFGDQSVSVPKGAAMHSVAEHSHGPLPGL
jgi:hypothetical protein